MVIPDFLQQHGPGDHLAGITHQVLQQTELPRLDINILAGPLYRACKQIHFEIGDPQYGLGFRRLPISAHQGFDTGQQFGE